ncbi:MAG: 50S ribosomal protein L32 [Dehalococcoidia bacterium]|nr:50S ribosomal protein L32 [Dehalococcoidia bacterium]
MALPKKKTSKARQGKRRSHDALSVPATDVCPHCHSAKLSHRVCHTCGWYNDREAVEVKPAKKK